jgi:hypothetical protein
VILAVFSFLLFEEISSLNGVYSFKQTYVNVSGLCSQNKSTMIFFYGNNCPSCSLEYAAFRNATSEFIGVWNGDSFLSPYFCAYDFNITAYNQNQSSIFAPVGAANIFESLSSGRIPFLFLGGLYTQYYKIGGFQDYTTAYQQIMNYICLSIKNVAPVCR